MFGLADLAARGTIVASTLVLCTDCLRGFYTLWVRHASTLPRLRVKPAIWTDPPPDSERAGSRLAPERVDSVNTPRNAVSALLSLLEPDPCKLSCPYPNSV